MQLPDEAITYQFQSLLVPAREDWTPAAELRAQHLLSPQALKDLQPRLMQVRGQVAAERELRGEPAENVAVDAGFIDLPQKTLDEYRKKAETGVLGRVLAQAVKLREQCDRVVVLGIGGSYLGARALFEALRSTYHNELPVEARMGTPRIYFEGNNADNDALHELMDLLQQTCVEPDFAREALGCSRHQ